MGKRSLGVFENRSQGILLLEAKSHVHEVFGGGCKATSASSIKKIELAIAATKKWLNVDPQHEWNGGRKPNIFPLCVLLTAQRGCPSSFVVEVIDR
jgi:hypothetical protein